MNRSPSPPPPIDRLTVFAFLWACQALVHHEFYAGWLTQHDPRGWLLTVLAVGVLLFPRAVPLLTAMLAASITYNVAKWPFVVNHILVESLIDTLLLGALVWSWLERRAALVPGADWRERVVDRFAPVARTMLIVVYYFAWLAKLNWDFFDPEVSCAVVMYLRLVERLPFLPTAVWAQLAAIWLTLLVELAIPVALTFRRSWYVGIVVGMLFHLVVALVGHRTFSALAFAMYSLFLLAPLADWCTDMAGTMRQRWGPSRVRIGWWVLRIAVVLIVASFIAAELAGLSRAGIGPVRVYRLRWLIWGLWSLVVAAVYLDVMRRGLRDRAAGRAAPTRLPKNPAPARPGWLWAFAVLVVLNGSCQYLGLKTQTSFTMYSNLRTEGVFNNHLFLPAGRLARFQDDLVEIVETDNAALQEYRDRELALTYFEFRRLVSGSDHAFEVTYRRGEKLHRFTRRDGHATDPELARPHPLLIGKLLYFRPVDLGEKSRCQH